MAFGSGTGGFVTPRPPRGPIGMPLEAPGNPGPLPPDTSIPPAPNPRLPLPGNPGPLPPPNRTPTDPTNPRLPLPTNPGPMPPRGDGTDVPSRRPPLPMLGGAQVALTNQLGGGAPQGFLYRRTPDSGSDINGNDIPTPPVDEVPTDGPVVGGGDPQMPVVLPDGPSAGGGSDGPPSSGPDASRWLHGGGPAPGSLSQIIQDRIIDILNQGPVDPNSEDIKNVVNAARVQERRQGDRARAFLAERRAASGLAGGGGFDTGVLGIETGIGERLGGLSANLVREAQITRAQQIMSALTLGQGRIDAESQRALQSELANIQATLQREGMSLQNEQFEAQMSMQALLAMLAGLGGGN